jgi:hypothetical protein
MDSVASIITLNELKAVLELSSNTTAEQILTMHSAISTITLKGRVGIVEQHHCRKGAAECFPSH